MPDSTTPPLHISQMYRKMIRDRKEDRDTKQFVRKNIRSAQWLIEAIGQRRETIRKVAKEVFERQREFLFTGSESLKPLPMADIADELGVHVATISRAVSGKYVQTPLGIYPLRMFFSGGKTTASGKDVSWNAIRAKLEEIVADEDKNKPLNDDLLAKKLKDCGITIARRTVAKYRNLMKIPSARKRREF